MRAARARGQSQFGRPLQSVRGTIDDCDVTELTSRPLNLGNN